MEDHAFNLIYIIQKVEDTISPCKSMYRMDDLFAFILIYGHITYILTYRTISFSFIQNSRYIFFGSNFFGSDQYVETSLLIKSGLVYHDKRIRSLALN